MLTIIVAVWLVMVWLLFNIILMETVGKVVLMPTIAIGDSMEPTYPARPTIHLLHWPTSIEEGDIVTYLRENDSNMIMHRVIERDEDQLLIKGDNNTAADGWFDESEIVGKRFSFFGCFSRGSKL